MNDFEITGGGQIPQATFLKTEELPEAVVYRLTLEFPDETVPAPVTVKWKEPNDGAYSVFAPKHYFDRYLQPSWCGEAFNSKANNSMPVFTALDKAGSNVFTFALSDALSHVRLHLDVDEPSGELQVRIDLFTEATEKIKSYETLVFCSSAKKPYYKVLRDVRDFWERYYPPFPVPEAAKRRTFSSWYCFHRDIDEKRLLAQCRLARGYGMDTVIIDDGWQVSPDTPKNEVYLTAGDWEPNKATFPDMKRFIGELHDMGMKAMLWFAVPFVGVKSRVYDFFDGRFLYDRSADGTLKIADPRYADIRKWYADMLAERLARWDLDGVKLDFIDSFEFAGEPFVRDDMDIPSLPDAVCALLKEITDALRAVCPDVLIEFRQSYIGPAMRQYGNMLRVCDCAYGAMFNRLNGLDMRLLAGDTAVHSDMLQWEYGVSAEKAADQLSSLLFIVPQISMPLDRLPEEHKKMLKYYLDFIDDNRDILLGGRLVPLSPETFYSVVYAQKEREVIAALYTANSFTAPENTGKLTVVNASGIEKIYVDLNGCAAEKYEIKNCMGEAVCSGRVSSPLAAYSVPHNGMLFFS